MFGKVFEDIGELGISMDSTLVITSKKHVKILLFTAK
jgi:hypothetical protein